MARLTQYIEVRKCPNPNKKPKKNVSLYDLELCIDKQSTTIVIHKKIK